MLQPRRQGLPKLTPDELRRRVELAVERTGAPWLALSRPCSEPEGGLVGFASGGARACNLAPQYR